MRAIVKLADICTKVTDGTHDSPKLQLSGVPFIKAKHVSHGQVDVENCDFITHKDHLKVISRSKPEFGDTLFVNIGASLGDCAFVPDIGEFSIKNVALFKPDPVLIDPKYLYYCVLSPQFRASIKSKRSGSAQPFGGLHTLSKHELEIFTAPFIQKQIAGILSAYDDLIAVNTRRIDALEEMARRTYEEWFARTPQPDLEKVKFTEIAEIHRGKSYRSADLIESTQAVPLVNLKNIKAWGGFRIDGFKRFSGDAKPKHFVHEGDIVMAVTDMTQERRLVAQSALIPKMTSEYAVFSMDLLKIIPANNTPKEFLYAFLRWSAFPRVMKEFANGANVLHLSPKAIANYKLGLPPKEIQLSYSNFLAPRLTLMSNLETLNTNLRAQRDLLLPCLLYTSPSPRD